MQRMVMTDRGGEMFEVVCPCCGARLKVDAALGKVIAHQSPPKHPKAPDLDEASKLLEKQAARPSCLPGLSTRPITGPRIPCGATSTQVGLSLAP